LHRIKNTFNQETLVIPLKEPEKTKDNQDTKKDTKDEELSFLFFR
jgi:hypothetical protein